jgi:uncharacterized protein (TIGR00725 family)
MLELTNNITIGSIAVFGSSQAPPGSPAYGLASAVGRAIARRGLIVRCGGYAGVMEGVARGAREAGGRVVGCTIEWFADTRRPNPDLDEVHASPDLGSRLDCLLRGTRGAIVLSGGVGTLNELFWLWTLLSCDRGDGRALVVLGEPWRELLDLLVRRFEFPTGVRELVRIAADPEEAAAIACGGSR